MGRPHEPLKRLEIEDFLSTANALRDSYALVPRSNQFGRDQALESFRAYVAEHYSRLKATLEAYVEANPHADAMRQARNILDVATDDDVLQFIRTNREVPK
jgi:hypothetical protein